MSSSDQTNIVTCVTRPESYNSAILNWKIEKFQYLPFIDFQRMEGPSFPCGNVNCQMLVYPEWDERGQEKPKPVSIKFSVLIYGIYGPFFLHLSISLNHIFSRTEQSYISDSSQLRSLDSFGVFFERKAVIDEASCFDSEGALLVFCEVKIVKGYTNVDVDRKIRMDSNEGKVPVPSTLDIDCSSSMGVDFLPSYENRQFCDVFLNVDGEQIHAHKTVLRARSSVFATMFSNNFQESRTNAVNITDIRAPIFKNLLFFMYSGKLSKIPPCDVPELYAAADKYNVRELKSKCEKFLALRLSVSNFVTVAELASQHSDKDLMNSVGEFIWENFRKIIATKEWKAFEDNQHYAYKEVMKLLLLKKTEK